MLIAFPDDDEPCGRVADILREAQRCSVAARSTPRCSIKNISGWNWPGRKYKLDERWALTIAALLCVTP